MDNDRWLIVFASILGSSIFYASCSAEKAPYYSFVKPATVAPPIGYFDYIVVGGGPAGCSLTATLSNGATVLLLERGGSPYGNKIIEDIRLFAEIFANLTPSSPIQRFVSEDGVINYRARVLGGGSAINSGFYTRAHPEFIAEVGLDYELVNQSYQWVEEKVAFKPPMLQFQTAVKDGLLAAGVRPYNGFTYDHIPGTKFGGSIFDSRGFRHSAADFLEFADPHRTTVYLYATAQKILFNRTETGKPRAYGVLYTDSNGVEHQALLRPGSQNEVILSAGAIGSPQMLMLSGIGPSTELLLHGIELVLDKPQVGQGLSDNPTNFLIFVSPTEVEVSLVEAVGITEYGGYVEALSDATNLGFSMQNLNMVTSQTDPTQKANNVITSQDDWQTAYELMCSVINGTANGGIILEKIAGPRSSGFLRLTTSNPNDTPTVTFNYFQDPEDLEKCFMGMKTMISVLESEPFQKFRVPGISVQALMSLVHIAPFNYRPRHFESGFSLEQFCIDTVMTLFHYHGGCQVNEVVDKEYKVLGTEGLRVIDGSTFHESPGTNPQATVMMLGRYMGQRILAQRQ